MLVPSLSLRRPILFLFSFFFYFFLFSSFLTLIYLSYIFIFFHLFLFLILRNIIYEIYFLLKFCSSFQRLRCSFVFILHYLYLFFLSFTLFYVCSSDLDWMFLLPFVYVLNLLSGIFIIFANRSWNILFFTVCSYYLYSRTGHSSDRVLRKYRT